MTLALSSRVAPIASALLTAAALAVPGAALVVPGAALVVPGAALAVPGERDKLDACKTMVDHAGPAPGATGAREIAELQKCRQIIKEWTLRDSRRSVDENGQPLK